MASTMRGLIPLRVTVPPPVNVAPPAATTRSVAPAVAETISIEPVLIIVPAIIVLLKFSPTSGPSSVRSSRVAVCPTPTRNCPVPAVISSPPSMRALVVSSTTEPFSASIVPSSLSKSTVPASSSCKIPPPDARSVPSLIKLPAGSINSVSPSTLASTSPLNSLTKLAVLRPIFPTP